MIKKNSYYFLFFVFLGFLTLSCNSNSSNTNEKDLIEIEKANLESKIGLYKMPTELKYSLNDENFLNDKLYPIGWSQDGKFAYIVEFADEAIGYSVYEFNILNTINNSNIWQFRTGLGNNNKLDTIWNSNIELVKQKLIENKIIQQENLELGKVSFKHNNKDFKIMLENKTKINEEYGFDVITESKISLTSKLLGTKIIYDFQEKGYSMVLGQIVTGQIMSPFEDRIIVILKNERWGYEGPPNVIYFTLIGSNLTESFKQ